MAESTGQNGNTSPGQGEGSNNGETGGTGPGTSTPASAPQSESESKGASYKGNSDNANNAPAYGGKDGNGDTGSNSNPGFDTGFSGLNYNSETGSWDTGAPAFPGLNTSDNGPGSTLSTDSARNLKDAIAHLYQTVLTRAFQDPNHMAEYRKNNPELAEIGDRAYQESIRKGKSQWDADWDGQQAIEQHLKDTGQYNPLNTQHLGFEGQFDKPSYDPSVTQRQNTPSWVADGTSKMNHSNPPAVNNGVVNRGNTVTQTDTSTDSSSAESTATGTESTVSQSGTVNTGGGTVTDSGTGGTISSSLKPPSRDSSSIGLGVYNEDKANYDQDDWNRGMEAQTSSLVSDEACKAFAKRAFLENSEPFKKVRVTIIKKV